MRYVLLIAGLFLTLLSWLINLPLIWLPAVLVWWKYYAVAHRDSLRKTGGDVARSTFVTLTFAALLAGWFFYTGSGIEDSGLLHNRAIAGAAILLGTIVVVLRANREVVRAS